MAARLPEGRMHSEVGGPREEWWAGTELGLLRAYHFPGHVTSSDGSVGSDCMGAGFTWMDRSLKRCGSERIGRDEEGTSSGRTGQGGKVSLSNTADADILELVDEGKTLAKAGDSYQWTNRTTRVVYSYYDRAAHQWKKGTWSKTIRNTARRGTAESLMEDRLQKGADK